MRTAGALPSARSLSVAAVGARAAERPFDSSSTSRRRPRGRPRAAARRAGRRAGRSCGRARRTRADRRQALAGVLAREVHRDLARPGDPGLPARGDQLLARDAERAAGRRPGSSLDRDAARRPRARRVGAELAEDLGDERLVEPRGRSARRRRRRGSARPRARAGSCVTRSAISSIALVVGSRQAVVAGALAQHRHARGEVRAARSRRRGRPRSGRAGARGARRGRAARDRRSASPARRRRRAR